MLKRLTNCKLVRSRRSRLSIIGMQMCGSVEIDIDRVVAFCSSSRGRVSVEGAVEAQKQIANGCWVITKLQGVVDVVRVREVTATGVCS
jgi:hypothetical protein